MEAIGFILAILVLVYTLYRVIKRWQYKQTIRRRLGLTPPPECKGQSFEQVQAEEESKPPTSITELIAREKSEINIGDTNELTKLFRKTKPTNIEVSVSIDPQHDNTIEVHKA